VTRIKPRSTVVPLVPTHRERDSRDKTGSERDKGRDVSGTETLKALAEAVFERDRPWDNRPLSPLNLVPTMLKERNAAWDKMQAEGFADVRPIVPLDQLQGIVEAALAGSRFLGVQPKGWLPDRGVDLDRLPLVRAVRKSISGCGSDQRYRHRSTSSMPPSNVRKLAIGVGTELHHLELRRALNMGAKP
jgi:hypothetical protein